MKWLSYGAGVNSTALLIALIDRRVSVGPFRVVFSDTKDERDETYSYLYTVAMPYARKHGITIEVCCSREGVLERWERLSVTGSRMIRSCTDDGKIKPIRRHILAHGEGAGVDVQLIGIHAGESHRAKPARENELPRAYPLIELNWGHDECLAAIAAAGLPIPIKSGCWHCPFMRRAEIVALSVTAPCKFERIIKLEDAANRKHPGHPRMQWNKPAREIRDGGPLFADSANDLPCGCWDGDVVEESAA